MDSTPAEVEIPLLYVAGPYGDASGFLAIEKNISNAREASAWLVKQGFYFLCPHLNSCHFEVITPEVSLAHWYGQDLRLMAACDAMIVVGDWTKSRGVGKELVEAGKSGLPVFDFTKEESRQELLAWRTQWTKEKQAKQSVLGPAL